MATHRGLYDFVAKDTSMLSIKTGDLFSSVTSSGNGWATVKNERGEKGIVPDSYLECITDKDEAGPVKGAPYVVLYDFRAKDAYQLSISRGDKVTMVKKYTKDWWSVKDSTGKMGIVPAAYVRHSPEDEDAEETVQERQSKEAVSEVLLSIDTAIDNLHTQAAMAGGVYSAQQRSTLSALVAHRQNVVQENRSPSPNYSVSSLENGEVVQSSQSPDAVLPQAQTLLAPSSGSKSRAERTSPRRKAPPPPRQTTSPPLESAERSASLGSLDIAGVQLRPQSTSTAARQRPQSEMIPRKPAPPPPKRIDSLAVRCTPPPSSISPLPAGPITEVSEHEESSVPCNDKETDRTESMAATTGSTAAEDSGTETRQDERSESREAVVDAAPTGDKVSGKEIEEAEAVADALTGQVEEEKEEENKVEKTVVRATDEEEVSHVVADVSDKESVEAPEKGLDDVATFSDEGSRCIAIVNPTAGEEVSSNATAEPVETNKKEEADLPSDFPPELSAEMVATMREITELSYTKSVSAVEGMLVFIGERVPSVATVMMGLINALHQSQVEAEKGGAMKAGGSRDLERLHELFFEIQEVKDDSQQRGWAVHDDSQAISQMLDQLLQLLYDADPSVSRTAVQGDRYENVLTLIAYYQLEARTPIRLLLLKIFSALCTLDRDVVSVLLSSTLPNELGRDIQQNLQETQKVILSSTVSTMIFSTAEAVPLTIYDQWDLGYIKFLFNNIEEAPSSDHMDEIPDSFLTLLLSYNQHFSDPSSNLVMKALKENMEDSNPKVFGEKLMLLVNRGNDPVAISESCCPDSLLKMLLDLFSDKLTAGIFYTTDFMVLIDIITRQLSDLSPGDKLRPHYLELLFRIVGTTDYSSHRHRQENITQCLQWIDEEEGSESDVDKVAVRKIWSKFSDLFAVPAEV